MKRHYIYRTNCISLDDIKKICYYTFKTFYLRDFPIEICISRVKNGEKKFVSSRGYEFKFIPGILIDSNFLA